MLHSPPWKWLALGASLALAIIFVLSKAPSETAAISSPAHPLPLSAKARTARFSTAPLVRNPADLPPPASALEWARAQPRPRRAEAIGAVLVAASGRPDIIMPLALQLFAEEPALLAPCGGELAVGLVTHGHFSSVTSLIAIAPPELQADWITLTFGRWGAEQPRAAFDALPLLPENQREAGFRALIDGWAAVRPAEVAEYAATFPPGGERERTFAVAIRNLSRQDPAALSAWLGRFPPDPFLDSAAAALVLQADTANRPPEVALQWAGRIFDPPLRAQAFVHALRELTQKDPTAVVAHLAAFAPAEREQIQRRLASDSVP